MDDQTLDARALTGRTPRSSPAAAPVPARPRTGRPIRFTPSHAEPITPPPRAAQPAAAPSSLIARAVVWLLVIAGWAVFAAWWVVVLQRETLPSFGFALGILAITLGVSGAAMAIWIRHNIRIARHGKRGNSSMYIPMVFDRDTLGRSLELPPLDVVHGAPEVRVVMRGSVKAYVPVEAEEL